MKPVTLMLVDDNPRFLSAASSFLGEVDDLLLLSTLEGGTKAVEKATELQPDVILVDLAMPDIAGLQLIPMLRESIPNIGIVALTVHDNPQYQEAAINAGADAFITKSDILKTLEPTIKKIDGQRKGNTVSITPLVPPPTTPSETFSEKVLNGTLAPVIDAATSSVAREPIEMSAGLVPENNMSTTLISESEPEVEGDLQSNRILVLDDDPGLRNIYSKALNHKGYEIDLAANLDEARKWLKEHVYGVFICDIHVGNERGTDLLAQVGPSLRAKGTQIIMASAYGQYRYIAEDYGSEYFLEKPVSIHTLVTLIERVLEDGQSNLSPVPAKTGSPAT